MIVFCEECGLRNNIDPSTITANIARFKCVSCGYQNTITADKNALALPDDTEGYFQTVQSIPEILGIFLFHVQKGILKNGMPSVLKPRDLLFIGKRMLNTYSACSNLFSDTTRLTLAIDGRNLIFQPVSKESALILFVKNLPAPQSVETMLASDALAPLTEMIQPIH